MGKTSIPANHNHRRPQCGITMTALQHWMELRRTLWRGSAALKPQVLKPRAKNRPLTQGTSRRNILTVAANEQSAHARHGVGYSYLALSRRSGHEAPNAKGLQRPTITKTWVTHLLIRRVR